MSRAQVTLNNEAARRQAVAFVMKAPRGYRVEVKGPQRSGPQNRRMRGMLADISKQVLHDGERLEPEAWKLLFLDQLNAEMRLVRNLDGTGFVDLGPSSSDLDEEEMGGLIELIFAYGAKHGVVFHDDRVAASREAA